MIMLISILFLFLFVSFFVCGFLLLRKYIHYSKMEIHNEVGGFIYAVLGAVYSILLAFVVVTVWEQYTDAEENVNVEVSHVIDLYRNANDFPDSLKYEIQTTCKQYMQDMVTYEWEAMKNNEISEQAKSSYFKIWEIHQNYIPKTEHEKIWYEESVKELNQLADARRFRINSIYSGIQPFLWFVLIIGAAVTIGFSFLFGTKNTLAHVIMIALLSTAIGLSLLLVFAFDHPFVGIIKVEPYAFIRALKQLQ